MSPRLVGAACAAAALVLDQRSKALALKSLAPPRAVEVLPVMNLVVVRNDGVSFGMLGGFAPWWGLVLLAAAIVRALLVWLWRTQLWLIGAGLGLVIGGALGNILDRVRHQAVTDFLDFHLGVYHWPAFNLADVAVVCGTAFLLVDMTRKNSHKRADGERRPAGSA